MKKLGILFLLGAAAMLALSALSARKDENAIFYNDYGSLVNGEEIFLSPNNIFSKEKAALGRLLFYDTRLSVNHTRSCGSCHAQQFAFTDGYTRSIGAFGDLHTANSRPLVNLVFNRHLTSGDSSLHFPEQQINNPMFNTEPVEMGWRGNERTILATLAADKTYRELFSKTFPDQTKPITAYNIKICISSFLKTIISFNSPFDAFAAGRTSALTTAQKRGYSLFQNLNCGNCHGGKNFNKPSAGKPAFVALPGADKPITTPTLRNLFFTAPYFHDGRVLDLAEAINLHYSAKELLKKEEVKSLVYFLSALSDSSVLINPAFADPFNKNY